jgi:AraC family transcriptional regulator
MSDFEVSCVLQTSTASLDNVRCAGSCAHRSAEECATVTHLVFPHRGVYLRHVGADQAVADANHLLFFNANEGYQVSHPVRGGDESLSLVLKDEILHELVPAALLNNRAVLGFRRQHQRIDPRAQALVAVLRHRLLNGAIETLEAENLVLTLLCRSVGPRTSHSPGATPAKRRLANRVKLLLAGDLSRRWTLAAIAGEIGGSPVYLTQVFQQVEGMSLYRYHLRLRLARSLDLIPGYEDLSALAADLGFSSHSHFAAVFGQTYGRSPSSFRESAACI